MALTNLDQERARVRDLPEVGEIMLIGTPAGTRVYVTTIVRRNRVVLEPATAEVRAEIRARMDREREQRDGERRARDQQLADERNAATRILVDTAAQRDRLRAWIDGWRWYRPATWRRPG